MSNYFPVKRGVRQGDPLSLNPFLVFIEPMFRLKMSNNLIYGVFIPGSNAFAMKFFVYTDVVTSMLFGLCSVLKAFDLFLEYEMATDLTINFKQSKSFFAAKIEHLPLLLIC